MKDPKIMKQVTERALQKLGDIDLDEVQAIKICLVLQQPDEPDEPSEDEDPEGEADDDQVEEVEDEDDEDPEGDDY